MTKKPSLHCHGSSVGAGRPSGVSKTCLLLHVLPSSLSSFCAAIHNSLSSSCLLLLLLLLAFRSNRLWFLLIVLQCSCLSCKLCMYCKNAARESLLTKCQPIIITFSIMNSSTKTQRNLHNVNKFEGNMTIKCSHKLMRVLANQNVSDHHHLLHHKWQRPSTTTQLQSCVIFLCVHLKKYVFRSISRTCLLGTHEPGCFIFTNKV